MVSFYEAACLVYCFRDRNKKDSISGVFLLPQMSEKWDKSIYVLICPVEILSEFYN